NQFNLPEHCFVISTTHTHSGPATIKRAYLGEVNKDYLTFLEDAILECVVEAEGNLEESDIFYGLSSCTEVGKNRREKGGITDSDVSVLSIYPSGKKELK